MAKISVHSWFNFVSFVSFVAKLPNVKANPFQTHPNPFFRTPNPVFGRISRIFDKFRQTFLCKANPFCPFKNLNTIILFLARIFGFLTLIPLLAQSFLRPQGLGSAESGIVLLYSEYFGLSRIRRGRKKESPKCKTNPMVCYILTNLKLK